MHIHVSDELKRQIIGMIDAAVDREQINQNLIELGVPSMVSPRMLKQLLTGTNRALLFCLHLDLPPATIEALLEVSIARISKRKKLLMQYFHCGDLSPCISRACYCGYLDEGMLKSNIRNIVITAMPANALPGLRYKRKNRKQKSR